MGSSASGYNTSSTGDRIASHVPGTESYAARNVGGDYDPYSTEAAGSNLADSTSSRTGATGGLASHVPGTDAYRDTHATSSTAGTTAGYGSSTTGTGLGTSSTGGGLASYIPGTDAHAVRQAETGSGYGAGPTGLATGNTIRPSLASGNTSTASIKSGIVGASQDTALSHDGSFTLYCEFHC